MNPFPRHLFALTLALTLLHLRGAAQMADLHCHSLLKPYYSGITDPWAFWEHACPAESYDVVLGKAADIPKFTQGNFESMLQGNVRLVYVSLTPLEYEMRHPKVFRDLAKLRNTYACMAGVTPDWDFFMAKKVDYFAELLGQIELLRAGDGQNYPAADEILRYDVLDQPGELDAVLQTRNRLGIVVAIEGGHALGEGPLTPELLASPDYQLQVMEHLDVLKGARAMDRSGKMLPFPVAMMSLNHFMWNGLGGHARTFEPAFGYLCDQSEGLDQGPTPLGERVVRRMLDRSAGRRIVVDVKHMSLASRKWYYGVVDSLLALGDTVPVVATHAGIAGEGWCVIEAPKDHKALKTAEWLNHSSISLFDEDVRRIAATRGILGIMLDKYRLGGPAANALVDDSHMGSTERRKAYVQLIALNMLEVVDALQCPEAWDIISIGSDYDGMISAMETYDQGLEFGSLREDLLAYFENPTDLWDLYPRRKVQRYMYGLSAEQVVDKVMGGNLIAFTQRLLRATGGSGAAAEGGR